MTAAIICTVLLGLLVFGLGFGVSLMRGATKTNFGLPDDPASALYKLSRAHSNTTEYAAMLSVLMLFVGAHDPTRWMTWVMVIVTGSRYLLVIGLVTAKTMDSVGPLRAAGAIGTYLGGLALVAAAALSI